MGAEDGPEGCDNVADKGGAVIVGQGARHFGNGVGVEKAVFLEAGLVGTTFEVVCLPKDMVAWMDVFCDTRADPFYYAGNVIAKHNRQATFHIEAPITDAMFVGVHCMGGLVNCWTI